MCLSHDLLALANFDSSYISDEGSSINNGDNRAAQSSLLCTEPIANKHKIIDFQSIVRANLIIFDPQHLQVID